MRLNKKYTKEGKIAMPKRVKNIFVVFLIVIVIFVAIKVFGIQDLIMKKIYPQTYSEYVNKYAIEYEVDPLLVYAVIKAESNFDKNAVSNRNAKGVMQIIDSTAEEIAGNIMSDTYFESNMLFDEETNIRIGTKYLSDLLKKYGDYHIAVAAYNAGIGTVDKWISDGVIKDDGSDIEKIPYKETNNYVRKISRDYKIYEDLYK